MDSMAVQFDKLMKPRIAKLHEAAKVVAEDINQKAKDNSNQGKAFGNDRYDRTYEPAYAKRRQKEGFQIQYTDLRKKQQRINTATVRRKREGAEIYYQNGGRIFKFHHDGIQYKNGNNKMRSIFPKEISSVPNDTNELALKEAGRVLRG